MTVHDHSTRVLTVFSVRPSALAPRASVFKQNSIRTPCRKTSESPAHHQDPWRPWGCFGPLTSHPHVLSADHPGVPTERVCPPLQWPDATEPGPQRGLHKAWDGEAWGCPPQFKHSLTGKVKEQGQITCRSLCFSWPQRSRRFRKERKLFLQSEQLGAGVPGVAGERHSLLFHWGCSVPRPGNN